MNTAPAAAIAVPSLRHFDNSEFIAWRSSDALATLMTNLNANGQLSVLAHSMGKKFRSNVAAEWKFWWRVREDSK